MSPRVRCSFYRPVRRIRLRLPAMVVSHETTGLAGEPAPAFLVGLRWWKTTVLSEQYHAEPRRGAFASSRGSGSAEPAARSGYFQRKKLTGRFADTVSDGARPPRAGSRWHTWICFILRQDLALEPQVRCPDATGIPRPPVPSGSRYSFRDDSSGYYFLRGGPPEETPRFFITTSWICAACFRHCGYATFSGSGERGCGARELFGIAHPAATRRNASAARIYQRDFAEGLPETEQVARKRAGAHGQARTQFRAVERALGSAGRFSGWDEGL